jgi:uncharacterized protein YndB with AHSA1/START domain
VTTVQVERVIGRPPRDVFDFVATDHFDNHPKWDPEVVEMTQTSPGPVRVGATGRVVRRQGRRTAEGTVTVTKWEPNDAASWDVEFGPFRLRQTVVLVPEEGGAATRLRLSIETVAHGPIKVLVPLLRSRFRKTMARSLANIADCLEQH